MKSIFQIGLLVIVLNNLGLNINRAYSQAWTRDVGEGYEQFGISHLKGNRVYNKAGNSSQLRRDITDITIQQYLELGVAKNFTIISTLPFKFIKSGNQMYETAYFTDTLKSGTLNGLGNAEIGCLMGIKQETKWISTVKFLYAAGAGKLHNETGLRTGTEFGFYTLSYNLGTSWKSNFTTFEIGGKLRRKGYSEQVFSTIQYGHKFNNHVWMIWMVDAVKSLGNGSYQEGNGIHSALYASELEYLSLSIKFGIPLQENKRLWLAVGVGTIGHLVLQAPAFSLAYSYVFN